MKILIFCAAVLLSACVNPPLSPRGDTKSTSTNTSDFDRDAAQCEREAALSSAGSKAQAFASCMRAKNHTPNRP